MAVSLALSLGCSAPPGTRATQETAPEPEPVAIEPTPVVVAPEREPVVEARGEDPELAAARHSIVDGRVSPAALATLAASNRPEHRRATRLLEVIDRKEPSPLVVIEPPPRPVEPEPVEPEPVAVEPAPVAPEPAVEPSEPAPREPTLADAEVASEPSDDDLRIDPIDPRAYAPDAAILAWIRDDPPIAVEPVEHVEPPRDPFAALQAIEEPAILIPIDWLATTPRVILTRLELVAAAERVRLDVVGSAGVPVRMQPLAAHLVRLRLEGAGAVPNFLAARPSDARVAVRAIRRGRGAVEIDVELAAGVALLSVTPLGNGAALEFGPIAAHNPAR